VSYISQHEGRSPFAFDPTPDSTPFSLGHQNKPVIQFQRQYLILPANMKFTALATTAVLAALGTARATPEVRNVVTNADHEYFTRMHFQPPGGGYTPRSALMDHEIKPGIDSARYEKYGAEDWAAVVLLECKKDRRCKSCIAFLGMMLSHSGLQVLSLRPPEELILFSLQ